MSFFRKKTKVLRPRGQSGFTLTETLIGLLITGIATGAIFGVYITNAKTYEVQNQAVNLQQSLRAALYVMSNEIKMTGYDPEETNTFGFLSAEKDKIVFSVDWDGNGGFDTSNEQITYSYYPTSKPVKLGRNISISPFANRPLAENIDGVAFAYAFDADGDEALDNDLGRVYWAIPTDQGGTNFWFDLDTNKDGNLDGNDGTGGTINGYDTTIPSNISDIRAVRIWLLGRTANPDSNYMNNETYVVGNKILTFNDHYRRRLLTTIVKCRNLGL